MARRNINILAISALKWTGMGEFNSDDHYIYYCGQESLRRNEVALIVNRVQNVVLGYNLKNDRMILVHFQGKLFNVTVIQVYAPTTNAKKAEVEWFYEVLTKPSISSVESVTQSCPTLYDLMDRSMPGLPVHHQLPEFTHTHIHQVGDAIQPSHPLSSPSPPAPNPSQHQSLSQ